ncbi:Gfo/Idh/MocA family oxidoreductase [Paenibacillus aurantius]|uniref:Gfo/Idh/MocA family oxidoreductase n=1 Tax=Paenibacillus aurantius TaxID=2918900 RepID=A0AA96RG31_9BACL|nr:Gfo/Idh/MocA family oxidoreductase [Paenibacillus aurantius]WNQ11893.1 Gfo/Idh/MocA family oxidoreductase [Paenibacillus aurantius]
MSKQIAIGFIGLDTSHVSAFAKLLNDEKAEYRVPGGKVTAAFPGGSPDFELSANRVEGFTKELKESYGVEIVSSPAEVAEKCDAIMLESVDGRVHLEQFRAIAPFGKPVFIDKPFTVSTEDAREILRLAEEHNVPLMSCSSLRYSEGLSHALADAEKGAVIGADCYGPMAIQPTQPGLFWYGIHTVEMLYRTLGRGCVSVSVTTNEDHDLVTGVWKDGRIGTIRGNRKGNNTFGELIHREKGSQFVDVYAHPKPYYASLLEAVMELFENGKEPIDREETYEIIRFIEAANESRSTGQTVSL